MDPEVDINVDEDILLGTPTKKSRGIYYNPITVLHKFNR